jgi:hypothetical protein
MRSEASGDPKWRIKNAVRRILRAAFSMLADGFSALLAFLAGFQFV